MANQTQSTSLIKAPRFIYGTAWKEDRTQALAELALRQGFRAIDTANQRKHYFEAAVGQGIADAIQGGVTTRDELFLQSKYTFKRGQDHRLPYNPDALVGDQVRQSFESSLDHLQTHYLDSYVLHGPSTGAGLQASDWAAWRSMEDIHAEGRALKLGISNVSLDQLKALCDGASVAPGFVQNRCYANKGWGRDVRRYCRANGILYQGFSLLTANRAVFKHPKLVEIARRHQKPPTRIVFRFALDLHIVPLTGTSNSEHMSSDLAAFDFSLSEDDVGVIERLLMN